MLATLTGEFTNLTPERRAAKAAALGRDPRLSARELAQAQVDHVRQSYVPPRSKRELGAEAIGVITFALLIPLDIALYNHEIFSFRGGQSWTGAVVAAVCVALYAWPHRWLKAPDFSELRILWWVLPFAAAFATTALDINSAMPARK